MTKIITTNKKAYYEYEILEKHIAGIVLFGTEIKNIKNNLVSIKEAFCFIDENFELYLKGSHITQHKETSQRLNHEPIRDRKLLMKKKEIIKLKEKIGQKGLTLVPLSIILSDTGYIKIEIGLGKGKKLFDKKNSIKEKDLERDSKREIN